MTAPSSLAYHQAQIVAARAELDHVMDRARAAAVELFAAGATEAEITRGMGVNRMTVRKWLGK